MKTTFVKLSRPLLIRDEMDGNRCVYKTCYGFEISHRYRKSNDAIRSYIGYLACLADWSNGGNYDWVHKTGEQCIKKFNLTFSVKTIFLSRELYEKSVENGVIIGAELYDDLCGVKYEHHYELGDDIPF